MSVPGRRCARGCFNRDGSRQLLPCAHYTGAQASRGKAPIPSPTASEDQTAPAPVPTPTPTGSAPDTPTPAPARVDVQQDDAAAGRLHESTALLAAISAARMSTGELDAASPSLAAAAHVEPVPAPVTDTASPAPTGLATHTSTLPRFLDSAMSRLQHYQDASDLRIITRRNSESDSGSEVERNSDTNDNVLDKDVVDKGKKRQRMNVNPRAEPTLTESKHREIWLNLPKSHNYAMKHYSYESNPEVRLRVAKRGAWRLVEQGAKLSARTGLAVIVAFGPLDETAKREAQDHFYASPNLCDAARPTLRNMTEKTAQDFKTTMHTYREAGRAETAKTLEANKKLVEQKTALAGKNKELEARIADLESSLASSSANSL
ncbi:hypothetical protein CF319_g4514 [Tilletia indica]|nr:hypothetical protein CF319_g4514 [Tilletia indica]